MSQNRPKLGSPKVKKNLPSLDVKGTWLSLENKLGQGEKIPNASIIYGIAAALLFAIALYYFFTGAWLTGFLVFVLAVAFFGYALHFMRLL